MMPVPIKKSFPAILAIMLFSACQNGPDNEAEEQSFTVQLQCQLINQDETAPRSAVYAVVNQNKVKLANISNCDSIPTASYEDYDIPKTALEAVGGWWAGAGDYFYAIQEDSTIGFYQGWADEGQEDDVYHYNKIGSFANGQFNLQMPVRKDELVGTYALSRESGSHILFVGLKEDTLRAEYFQMDGVLPPVNQLNILMTSMEPQAAANLEFGPSSLDFTSSLGNGRFILENKGTAVLLQDAQAPGQPLRMEKILSEDYSIPVQ